MHFCSTPLPRRARRAPSAAIGLALLWACSAATPLPAQVGFRQVTSTHPVAVQQGQTSEVRLRSNFTLDETYEVFFARPGLKMTYLETKPVDAPRKGRGSKGTPFRFEVEAPSDQLPGVYEYRVATRQAVSSVAQLLITEFPVLQEQEKTDNGTPDTAQDVELPAAVCGVCEAFEDVDCYRFEARAGQQIACEIFAQRVTDRIHSMVVRGPRIYLMDPILSLIGPNGQTIAQNDNYYGGDSFLRVEIPSDGQYVLEVRDARYAGDPRYTYCVEIAERPYVDSLFPMAVPQGQESEVTLAGALLGDAAAQSVAAAETEGWSQVQFDLPQGRTNPVWIKHSSLPLVEDHEPNNAKEEAQKVALPCGVNGRLEEADDVDYYAIEAKKGQMLRLEVEARRYGSALDSVIEVWDSNGKRLAEADDISGLKTKDSQLFWKAPADGTYLVSVRDLHDRGGLRFGYHLEIAESGPDFELFGEYYYAMLAPGTRMMWFVKLNRQHGFDGPVVIEAEGLPKGVELTPITIPGHMNHGGLILTAADDAEIGASLVRVRGRATVAAADGEQREIVRYGHVTCEQQGSGGGQSRWPIETQLVAVTKPLDLVNVRAEPSELVLKPGESQEIKVTLERREGFKDAVSLAMSFDYFANKLGEQLPPGVTMSAKSKARVTGKSLEGTIILEADKNKTKPVERLPIAVLARVSITFSITTNYASNPIYLTVPE